MPLGGGGYASDLQKATFSDAHQSIDEAVDRFVRLCEEAGAVYKYQKVGGDPFLEFIERSKFHDLMVCGLHRLFEHGVLPEPKDELAKLVAAGVRPIIATAAQYREIKRVLVAYSNSVESAKTMRRFTQLSHLLAPNAEVQIVSFGKKGDDEPAELLEAQSYMQAHGIDAEIQFVEGQARTGVLSHSASWNADMIVMGNKTQRTCFAVRFSVRLRYTRLVMRKFPSFWLNSCRIAEALGHGSVSLWQREARSMPLTLEAAIKA